jgi:hypothetical protein
VTPRSVADTAGGVEATTALRLPSVEEPPPPLRWGQWVVLVAGGVLVVVGVLHLVGASTIVLAGALAGGVVAAVGTGVWGWRANQRRRPWSKPPAARSSCAASVSDCASWCWWKSPHKPSMR